MPSTLTADCSFSTADSSTSTLSHTAPALQMLFPKKQFCQFRTTDSSPQSLAGISEQRNAVCPSVPHKTILPYHSPFLYFFYSVYTTASTCCKRCCSPFCVCVKLNVVATGNVCCCEESWRDSRSVSLSTSLQPSFMPLSLAQRLTLRTPLSSLTLLHTGPRFWPQQYIDLLLRRLINISRCANAVHPRGGGVYIH